MKTVLLYGELGRKFGRVHRLHVSSPAEALRAFIVNYREFEGYLIDCAKKGVNFTVRVGGEYRDEKGICSPSSDKESIRIAPCVQGAGGSGGQIITGIVLVAAAVVLQQYELIPAAVATFATNLGVAMALSGVAALLTEPSKQRIDEKTADSEKKVSYYFQGGVNITSPGGVVPCVYGLIHTGSVVISAGVSVGELPL